MQIPVVSAIHLLHETETAVLATQSTQMPGYPYATAVPLVVDAAQRPLLLLSALAEHTRNLLADPRVSLAVTDDRATDGVQNAARMTVLGTCERFEPSPATVARYLRYQPLAEQYLQLDFMFFRLHIERVRFIGGVGKMGWLDAPVWQEVATLAPEMEDALLAEAALPDEGRLIGLDAYGVDYERGGGRQRQRFAQAVTTAAELRLRLQSVGGDRPIRA